MMTIDVCPDLCRACGGPCSLDRHSVQFCSGMVDLVVCVSCHGGGRRFRACPSTVSVVLTASSQLGVWCFPVSQFEIVDPNEAEVETSESGVN
jgi:hypothetical protein